MNQHPFRADPALPLRGVLPVAQLPYHDDETIDFETLRREIDWLFECGANGVAMAMVTETLRITHAERQAVAACICDAVGQRGASIISVGSESTFEAVELARHAESLGATAVMAIPPISVPPLADELIRYYQRIIDAISVPLIVQDASGYVGGAIGVQTMAKLLNEFGADRILFKPEAAPLGPKLSELRDATSGRAQVFEGSGGSALLDNYRRGIVGTMPGADLVISIVALWKALTLGDEATAYRISLPLAALVTMQVGLDGYLAIEKHLLVKQGVFRNVVTRGPVGWRLDAETCREVDRLFALLMDAIQRSF